MSSPITRRLYRARPLATLVLSLPGAILVFWYAWGAFSNLKNYQRVAKDDRPLSAEMLQIAVYDQLTKDVRRMSMGPPPDPSTLPIFRLGIGRDAWHELVESASTRENRQYVPGKIGLDGVQQSARIRLRGGRHWHLLPAQKSLKIKLDKGTLLGGHRVFNLINDPTPMVVGEEMILDLARERNVLTPVSDFVRVHLNSKDLGVYHYETSADEGMLRHHRRMPGSVYNGELPGGVPTEELWTKSSRWTKIASRTDGEAEKSNFSDLDRFLKQIHSATGEQFADFAKHELDLKALATLDMLDVAFGGDQHDFRENHKYYLDPYRGRWEPVAWNFRGFRDDPLFNLVDNPLLLRLKLTPGYITLRDQLLYDFLTSNGSPAAIEERARKLLTKLAPELLTDPHWDAYRQLPRVDTFHRRMLRPHNIKRLAMVVESELTTYGRRHAQLLSELETNPFFVTVRSTKRSAAPQPAPISSVIAAAEAAGTASTTAELATTVSAPAAEAAGAPVSEAPAQAAVKAPGAMAFTTDLSLLIDGRSGVALKELIVDYGTDCLDPQASLFRNNAAIRTRQAKGQLEIVGELKLLPTVQIVPRDDPNARRGKVRSALIPVVYEVQLRTSCSPKSVKVEAEHLATHSRVRAQESNAAQLARLPKARLAATATPKLLEGEAGPHPWSFEVPSVQKIELGPGIVDFPQGRIFNAHERVTIAADTTLRLGKGQSLVFLGQVKFKGRRGAPIVIEGLSKEAWGGVAIQGEATAGSMLRHVIASGGTTAHWRHIPYPGMINIHDTADISVKDCRFGDNQGSGDLIHAVYVKNLKIRDTEVLNVGGDAIDLEYSDATLQRLNLVNVGDDALDLMGTNVTIIDSVLLSSKGNGISAGEESEVLVRNSLIAQSKTGVLTKNASKVSLLGSVLFANKIGVKTYDKTLRYSGKNEVSANVVFVVASTKKAISRGKKKKNRLDRGQMLQDLPQQGVLDHVLENVLELDNWQALDTWIVARKLEAVL